MEGKYWYAVQTAPDDFDWGYGNYDHDEAVEMARRYDYARLSVIDESGSEPMCIYTEEIER